MARLSLNERVVLRSHHVHYHKNSTSVNIFILFWLASEACKERRWIKWSRKRKQLKKETNVTNIYVDTSRHHHWLVPMHTTVAHTNHLFFISLSFTFGEQERKRVANKQNGKEERKQWTKRAWMLRGGYEFCVCVNNVAAAIGRRCRKGEVRYRCISNAIEKSQLSQSMLASKGSINVHLRCILSIVQQEIWASNRIGTTFACLFIQRQTWNWICATPRNAKVFWFFHYPCEGTKPFWPSHELWEQTNEKNVFRFHWTKCAAWEILKFIFS